MDQPVLMLEYTGDIDHRTIDRLLASLKKSGPFIDIGKPASRRVYAVLVECLENMARYSVRKHKLGRKYQSFITASNIHGSIIVKCGNIMPSANVSNLERIVNQVNDLRQEELHGLYERIISKEINPGDIGAGLGFIVIRLKSGNPVSYNMTTIDKDYTFYELQVSINRHVMRKLIIDRTTSSPGVILDPERRIFEISGESRPHDVGGFYGEIMSWFNDYSEYLLESGKGKDPAMFDFYLEYFNSSSAKYILDFCKQMASVKSKGGEVAVRWQYEKDDADMLEAGREMSRIARIPFEFIAREDE